MRIQSIDEAQRFLEPVNYIHDGFIQTLALRSEDTFEIDAPTLAGVGHSCTGEFNAEIVFLHHPTIAGLPSKRLASHFCFRNVTGFRLDLMGHRAEEWALYEVTIEAEPESRSLRLCCSWNRFTSDGKWVKHNATLFSFSDADVEVVEIT